MWRNNNTHTNTHTTKHIPTHTIKENNTFLEHFLITRFDCKNITQNQTTTITILMFYLKKKTILYDIFKNRKKFKLTTEPLVV